MQQQTNKQKTPQEREKNSSEELKTPENALLVAAISC